MGFGVKESVDFSLVLLIMIRVSEIPLQLMASTLQTAVGSSSCEGEIGAVSSTNDSKHRADKQLRDFAQNAKISLTFVSPHII